MIKRLKMRKFLILILISTILLSGCSPLFNLSGWVMPDDLEFLMVVESRDTPEKICAYMQENFTYETNSILLNPYKLFIKRKGNCDDFSLFAIFIANYHNYETYQILIEFPLEKHHTIGVFKEGNYYNISENTLYIECLCENFKEIMNFYLYREWISYKVFNYENNLILTENKID